MTKKRKFDRVGSERIFLQADDVRITQFNDPSETHLPAVLLGKANRRDKAGQIDDAELSRKADDAYVADHQRVGVGVFAFDAFAETGEVAYVLFGFGDAGR